MTCAFTTCAEATGCALVGGCAMRWGPQTRRVAKPNTREAEGLKKNAPALTGSKPKRKAKR